MKPVFTALFVTLLAGTASAGVVCMEPAELEAALIDWYGEEPVSQPVNAGDSTVVVWASTETGTWTVVRTYDGASSCVVAQGEGWNGDAREPMVLALGG